MTRGEVWWASLPAPSGRRPVVLVSRQSSYAIRNLVTVVEVSRTIRNVSPEVPLGRADGLPGPCVANADSLVTIPKSWLKERIAILRPDKLAALDAALRFSLGLV